jgi:alcohol dehydrogenase (cytochrome c)
MPVTYRTEDEGYGAVRAIDPKTGDKKWDFKMVDYTESGVLTTASDLLFSGGREGHFFALDARTGDLLWKTNLGGTVASGPITFAVDGKQYVAVAGEGALRIWASRLPTEKHRRTQICCLPSSYCVCLCSSVAYLSVFFVAFL